MKQCKTCNKTFKPTGTNHVRCSKKCNRRASYLKTNPYKIKLCIFCNKQFTTRNGKKKYCNSKCKKQDYYLKNKDKINTRNKLWAKNNKDKVNRRAKHLYKNDPIYRIKNLLRSRLGHAIRGNSKKGSAIQALGCSIEEFRQYIESQFKKGMTWDNWSLKGWHIDHIIPLKMFNLEDPIEFKKACHYTNLQPMWAKNNLSKGCKI